jgi:transglutaminase-like putative cysteine protease
MPEPNRVVVHLPTLAERIETLNAIVIDEAATPLAGVLATLIAREAPSTSPRDLAETAEAFIHGSVRYLQSPVEALAGLTVVLANAVGDCDQQASALASLLLRLGLHPRWELASTGPRDAHLWVAVWIPAENTWIPLDPTGLRGGLESIWLPIVIA